MSELSSHLTSALGANYTIERELGGGGMSRVFVARDAALGRDVVIKTLSPELAAGMSVERFAREVKLAARLQQANIVPVLSAGDANGIPYFTMPYVDGLSLRARLRVGPVPLNEALHILRDVAKALAFAHAQGVVHRDIKPENVLLSGGTAMVADFGIAKALVTALATARGIPTPDGDANPITLASITQLGNALGTPAYMAPEQAAADPNTDHRADLYAWGVVAYELLGGKHPFSERVTPQALLAAHMAEAPAPLRVVGTGVPVGIADLVMRCLEKDPAKRPASANELIRSLDGATTVSSSVKARSLTTRWSMPRAAALGTAVVVLAALGAWMIGRPPRGAAATSRNEKSLAVLPFESVGGDTANAYLAEGIADELTTSLAKVPGLRLAGRRSALRFAGKNATVQEIGSQLGVNSVLEGKVRRAGNHIRVTAQLTNASDGLLLWTESFEREVKDVFAVQDEIARAITSALSVRLASSNPTPGNAAQGTNDLEAYDLYLRAQYLFRRRGPGLVQALAYADQAIARDSMFARAHAARASILVTMPYYLTSTRPGDVLPRALASAQRAAQLNPTLTDAHLALGYVYAEKYQWSESEAELQRAIQLDSTNAEPRYRYGVMLVFVGRTTDALAQLARAQQLDPMYGLVPMYMGLAHSLRGEHAASIAAGQRGLGLDPAGASQLNMMTNGYAAAGMGDSALAVARRLIVLRPNSLNRLSTMSLVFARFGARREADSLARWVLALPESGHRPGSRVSAYLALGDTANALTELENAAATDGDLAFSTNAGSVYYDVLRGSPRFAAVLAKFHLDVAQFTAARGGKL